MTFETSAYTITLFLGVFGILFTWISYKEPASSDILTARTAFALFALVYFALAHFSMYAGVAHAYTTTNQAPCEDVIDTTIEAPAGTITYAYTDSCASRSVPKSTERLFVLFTWLLWIDLAAVFAGVTILLFRWVRAW